jgi:flagellar biosynthesis/type III secretory pathway chaperone
MRHALKELCELLSEQKGALEQMLELAREERRVIISGEAERLEEVVRMELRELSKLNAIEKKRMALHPAISAELGVAENEITVSAIAVRAEPDEREEIKGLQAQLTILLKQHTDMNKENRELIEAHFEYTDALLNLMVDSEDPLNNFYGGDGKAAPGKKKTTGFFDSHA